MLGVKRLPMVCTQIDDEDFANLPNAKVEGYQFGFCQISYYAFRISHKWKWKNFHIRRQFVVLSYGTKYHANTKMWYDKMIIKHFN